MKLELGKDWWLNRARREGDAVIGAGLLACDPAPEECAATAPAEDSRIAFGKLVNLMRRRRGLSMEQLADAVEVDVGELLVIEDDVLHRPEPRTVYRLAQTFEVSQRRLMQLAGLTAANDVGLRQEAVRFAARSESVQKLTPEKSSALEVFVTVLSEQKPKRGSEKRQSKVPARLPISTHRSPRS